MTRSRWRRSACSGLNIASIHELCPSKAAMKRPAPLSDYINGQGRFKNLSPEVMDEMRQQVERNIQRLSREEAGVC